MSASDIRFSLPSALSLCARFAYTYIINCAYFLPVPTGENISRSPPIELSIVISPSAPRTGGPCSINCCILPDRCCANSAILKAPSAKGRYLFTPYFAAESLISLSPIGLSPCTAESINLLNCCFLPSFVVNGRNTLKNLRPTLSLAGSARTRFIPSVVL